MSILVASVKAERPSPNVLVVQSSGYSSLTYVLRAERECWVVDPGSAPAGELSEALKQSDIDVGVVSRVFLTHCHFDHVANAHLFPNATIHGSALTLQRVQGNDPKTFLGEMGMHYSAKNKHEPLSDGQTIVGKDGLELTCIHVPGHVQDAVVYHSPTLGIVFSGDSLFAAPSLPRLFESPRLGPRELAASLRKLVGLRAKTLAPGHPPLSDDFGREFRDALAELDAQGSGGAFI